jgi:hypothetical protein
MKKSVTLCNVLFKFLTVTFLCISTFKGAYASVTVSAPVNKSTAHSIPANSPAGTTVGITAFSTASGNTGVNLALNKTVAVSSVEGASFAGSYAVDGVTTGNRWSSGFADPQDITVDLGAVYNINQVTLYWENAYGSAYKIQTSTDNSVFSDIYGTTTGDGGTDDLTALTGSGRYIKMYGTTRATQYGYSLYDFQIFGSTAIVYSLTNSASGNFTIDPATGVVSVSSGSSLTAGTYSITVVATSSSVTSSSSSFSIVVTAPGPVVTGGGSGCGAGSITLTAQMAGASGGTYTWYNVPSGGTALATGSPYSPSVSGTYYATYTAGTTTSARSWGIAVTINAVQTAAFTATAVVGVGNNSTVALTSTYSAASTYAWDFNGGTPSTGTGQGPFSVTWATAGTKTITLTVTGAGNCQATATQTVTVSGTFADYGFSKPIVLNTSQITNGVTNGISTTLTNFPALVYIKDAALITGAACGDKVQYPLGNGGGLTAGTNYDFAFTLPGSTTELNYQVDTYDSVNGILFCWVQIPSLTSTDLPLTFYFGSKAPAHSASFSAATWASDYKAVYHFNEASTSVPVLDATSNIRNAVQANTAVTNDEIHLAASVPIPGGGYSFNGKSSSIIQNTGTNPDITDMFTLSAWIYYNGSATSDNKIISNEINYTQGYKLSVKGGKLQTETRYVGGTATGNLGTGGAVSSKTWHYIQGVFTGGTTSAATFINYVDGVAVPSASMVITRPRDDITPNAGDVAQMGIDYLKKTTDPNDSTRATNWYNGYMDEVRISNTAKTADWIRAEYYNQTKPIDFTNFSAAVISFKDKAPLLTGALVYTWTGQSTSSPTDQAQADNWDEGHTPVFNGNTKMVIPVVSSGKYPILTANSSIYSLSIASGASLNLNGFTLNVGCDIYNSATTGGTGILSASNSTSSINWNGALATQTYYGDNVKNTAVVGNMTINNSVAGTIKITGGPVDLHNTLTLTKGNLLIDNTNNGLLTLKSTATRTAAVDVIPAAYSIKGLVNVERFITGGGLSSNRGYRLLSSPVNQTADAVGTLVAPNTFGLYYLGSHVYGGVTYPGALTIGIGGPSNGFGVTNNNPTIYFYDESEPYNGRSFTLGNHVPVYAINTDGTQLIGTTTKAAPVGNGFLMYFVGPSSSVDASASIAPTDVTLTANGHLNQGTIPVQLWKGTQTQTLSYTTTPAATHPFPGLTLVGNPYPSTIDLAKVISDNSTSINNIYVLSARNSPNQKYIAFTANGASAPNQGNAVSGEGFFVTAIGTGKKLTFYESEKVSTVQLTGAALIMSTPNAQVKSVGGKAAFGENPLAAAVPQGNTLTGLYMKLEHDSITYDYCGIYFRKDWSATITEDDAKDMNSTTAPVAMASLSSDGILASVNHMPDYTKGINVKLYANAKADGQYKLKIEGIRNIDTLYDIFLIDHYKKDSLDIRRYGTYVFDITKADTSSFGASRFELSVRPRPLPAYDLILLTAQKATGGVQITWKTRAEANYTGFVLQKQDGTAFKAVYTRQSDGSGIYTYLDPSPLTGSNTYRLQQDNLVGAVTYSSPITIVYNPNGSTGLMSVYPNPAKATINVNVSTATTIAASVAAYNANIYNAAGQLMSRKSVSNSWTEDITQYMPGTYIILLRDDKGNVIGKSKFVKTN